MRGEPHHLGLPTSLLVFREVVGVPLSSDRKSCLFGELMGSPKVAFPLALPGLHWGFGLRLDIYPGLERFRKLRELRVNVLLIPRPHVCG